MTELNSIQPTIQGSTTETSQTKRLLLAALLSSFLPGAGQLFLGKWGRASVFFLSFCATLALYWPLRLPRHLAQLMLLSLCIMAVCIAAASETFTGKPKAKPTKWWLLLFVPVAIAASVLHRSWAVRAAGFPPFIMPSVSMEKTLMTGDCYIVDARYYRNAIPSRGDIVLFQRRDYILTKRVIAIAGDRIEGREGLVFLNSKQLNEPYVEHINLEPEISLNNFGPMTIPPNKLFVMGDNRDNSLDSRTPEFGLVDADTLVGKALYVYLPKNRVDWGKSLE